MKKILFILLSLFWAVYVQAASLSVDIHTPNLSKPYQFAKVYFLPDWNDKDFAFADQDEMPCTEVCPQKTDYDCKYGTESYVNGCGLTCSRCLECYGCEARGYTLSECPVNGICLNDCCNKLYKLESCKSGYVKEGNSCRAENCTENASLCDSTTEKCVNGKCVEKDCTEYPGKCGSNQTCVDGECIAKDCNNTPSLCTATEKCQLQNGVYKCVCSPTCTNETNCPNGYDTPVANGCGGTCSVCKTCTPNCKNETGCSYGTKTIADGCGNTCTVCKSCTPNCENEWNCGAAGFTQISNGCGASCRKCNTPTGAVVFTFSPTSGSTKLTIKNTDNNYGFNINTGDGSNYKNLTSGSFSHTYTQAGNYDVTITGDLRILGSIQPADKITKLKQLNLSNIEKLSFTFENAVNMEGPIPHLPPNLISVYYPFSNCSKLTGKLPPLPSTLVDASGLFSSCTSRSCTTGFTGSIPELPPALEIAESMFAYSKSLTGNIPPLPKSLKNTYGMFRSIPGLTGVTTVDGQYPYQYLKQIQKADYMVTGTSDAVRSKFPQSWGGTLPD